MKHMHTHVYARRCCVCMVGVWTQLCVWICLRAPSMLTCCLAQHLYLLVAKYFPNWVSLCRIEHCLAGLWNRPKGLDTLVAEAVMAGGMIPEPGPSPDPKVRPLVGGWALQLCARCLLASPQHQGVASDSARESLWVSG